MDRELIISEIVFLKVQIKYARTHTYIDTRRIVSILSIHIQVPKKRIGFLCGDIENTHTHTQPIFHVYDFYLAKQKVHSKLKKKRK